MPLPPAIDAFLCQPNQAVVALLRPSGAPHTAATCDWDGRELLLNVESGRARVGWAQGDGRVALTAIDPATFDRHVTGRVDRVVDDPGWDRAPGEATSPERPRLPV